MNSSMQSLPDVPSLSAGTLTSDSIRQWRERIEDFFSVEGGKVRSIMLQLEESLWQGELPANIASQSAEDKPNVAQNEEALPRTPAPVSGDPKQLHRLEVLAKRIGDRLKLQSAASSTGSNTSHREPDSAGQRF